jgi:hypothetical protein
MEKKIAVLTAVLIAVVLTSVIIMVEMQNLNPKIFCDSYESETSNWYHTENSPVVSGDYYTYYEGFNVLPKPSTVNLGVKVFNGNPESLFNVHVEVSYKTDLASWNTTVSQNLGFLDIRESKTITVALTNPYLTAWQVKNYVMTTNITVWVLEASDYKISAYGYAH